MMTPCKKLYYAIEAVLYIAYHSDECPVSSRDIAAEQHLPPRHLEQIMQRLVHGNVLRGLRGPKGGYQLARPASDISLAEICSILNEGDKVSEIPPTTPLGELIVRPFWEQLCDGVRDELKDISIGDLCERAHTQQIAKNSQAALDSLA